MIGINTGVSSHRIAVLVLATLLSGLATSLGFAAQAPRPAIRVEIEATDSSGNQTKLSIPIKVLPVQLKFERISMEWQRHR